MNLAPVPKAETPHWSAAEIDAFLLLLANAAAPHLSEKWPAFTDAAKRQTRESVEAARTWDELLQLGPKRLAHVLTMDHDGARALRRFAPLFALVSRGEREQLLRDAALQSRCGALYGPRWEGDPPDPSFVDNLVEHLLATIKGQLQDAFTEFVVGAGCSKWIVAADFCLADSGRPNDVMAFTVFPYDTSFEFRSAEIRTVFPRDLKATRYITSHMLEYLRSANRFDFVFIMNRRRRIFQNVNDARDALDRSVAMMSAYRDANLQLDRIAAVKALRQEANANNFNFRLLQDIMLMATFGGFIAALLEMEGRAELVGFFPDQDKMTTAYRAIAYETFGLNASAFALRRKFPESQIFAALPGPRTDGLKGIYYDEFIRIPDYLAGAVAATDFEATHPTSQSRKCLEIIGGAIVDNSNIAILKVNLPPRSLSAQRVVVQSKPPAAWKASAV